MRYLTLSQVAILHRDIIAQSGGSHGVRDMGALESAIAQPRQSFAGADLYPTVIEKACSIGFALVCNHPFIDGNKRIGHAAMEVFLVLNGFEIHAHVDDQEHIVLELAAGQLTREELLSWLRANVRGT